MNQQNDLFSKLPVKTRNRKPSSNHQQGEDKSASYSAADIEVLEGLEPVRRRPGMYIGGTDEKAFHHLFVEILDNAMDEAVAGYANLIEIELSLDNTLSVTDNGRGIPVDPHPKFSDKSALEVILTTLHAGGKFNSKAYETSGGLHGVGISVVNALSEFMEIEVARKNLLYRQSYARGVPLGPIQEIGEANNRQGTKIIFIPDIEIFGAQAHFSPERIYSMARSKACLFAGVKISWRCEPSLIQSDSPVPVEDVFHFPGGLKDYLVTSIKNENLIIPDIFSGKTSNDGKPGSVEWSVAWVSRDGFFHSYCNTIPTREGGFHETGFKNVITRGLRAYAELTGNKRASVFLAEDVMGSVAAMLSIFIREPQFSGQTKDRLSSPEALRIVETAIRDNFDHWLVDNPQYASQLLEWVITRAEERTKRRQENEINRKSPARRLRLPGKLADCVQNGAEGTELFIVEGDSAGGSAKQARDRILQAVLPLRGKILNVVSAGNEKLAANQQITDLVQALGCGVRARYRSQDLRYNRIIIMTDADVDGAHIASLLITFFYQEMPNLIHEGHLFLAVPPLYRLNRNGKTVYARNDEHKEELLQSVFTGSGKVEISRFKGLGEMLPKQLQETTMDISKRTLLKITIPQEKENEVKETVSALMGVKPELRFHIIQEKAEFTCVEHLDL